jgi:hypothetical protein
LNITRNLKHILVYSDSELAEFIFAAVLVLVNPLNYHILCCSPPVWPVVGVLSGVTLLIGLLISNIHIRLAGLLGAVAFFVASNVIEVNHGHWNYSEHSTLVLQAVIAMFLWVRDDRERHMMSTKRGV